MRLGLQTRKRRARILEKTYRMVQLEEAQWRDHVATIRTEEDHKAALEEVEALWEAAPGTPEADKLEALATLIEAYEAKHHPIDTRRSWEDLVGSQWAHDIEEAHDLLSRRAFDKEWDDEPTK